MNTASSSPLLPSHLCRSVSFSFRKGEEVLCLNLNRKEKSSPPTEAGAHAAYLPTNNDVAILKKKSRRMAQTER